ncbi:MAG: hypothetical protein ABIX12_03855 [Rubrivivax sp.]
MTIKPTISNARRRMLRGVVAAPVLATVHPGSAWANGSLLCIVRPGYKEFPGPIKVADGETPVYLRVLLGQLEVPGSSTPTLFVDGGNVVAASQHWGFTFAASYVGPKLAGEYQAFEGNRLVGSKTNTVPGSASAASGARASGGMSNVFGGLVYDRRTGPSAAAAPAAAAGVYKSDGEWAAVMSFNEAGEAVGVGIIGGETYAVAESCWSSLRPTNLG